jgi:hypothetical protein
VQARNALHDIEQRLRRSLLQIHDRCSSDAIPPTQKLLSEMLGVHRAQVTAIGRSLRATGLIAGLRRLHSDLIDPAIAAHHSRIVKRIADGSIIEYLTLVDAVCRAIGALNALF